MPPKVVMRSLRIDEIAGVAKPAMGGALVSFIKRASTPREEPMADPTKTPEEILKAEKAELEKKLARSTALAALTDADKAYMKGLPEADGEKFLVATPEARAATIKAAGESNPVIFKSADGIEVRKNDSPALVEMAKRLDAQAQQIAKSEALAKEAVYQKRAAEEIPHLAGDVPTRTAMLKAIDGIPDEGLRAKALETLKAQNAEMAKAFETRGTRAGGGAGSPEDKLDVLAKTRATKDGIPYAKAYDLVLQSPEGSALYAEFTKSRQK